MRHDAYTLTCASMNRYIPTLVAVRYHEPTLPVSSMRTYTVFLGKKYVTPHVYSVKNKAYSLRLRVR